ncbi:hypothetical protein GVN21_16860 [Caulobacter sp. SLTY]|uniref:phage minor head protein n=1 Tax=Caulobacter sp. SLTY TaxID=2683262 RepID=UPI001412070D|nr:phage minor head protein [Caulobacter sp. SLTY]NBB17039.1 hypothetical protein [Caulobacter sp. SLTY]
MTDVNLEPLPPAEAIAFFRSKGLVESFSYLDVSAEEHAVAFTVAKTMRRDVLQDLREGVDRALAEGKTFEQFRDELRPLLEERGWWGRRAMTDPLTGREREVQLGSSRRLRTIFNTNLRQAYAAGRWERIEATKAALPFLRYTAVGGKEGDGRTRPQHRAWHGTCLPVDDPWWDEHYPPCDYGCRCSAEQVSRRTMERRGWTVETPAKFPKIAHVNKRTGQVSLVEDGIQPGFDFNPGKARLAGLTPSPAATRPLAELARGGTPPIERRTVDFPRGERTQDDARADFFARFRVAPGEERIFTDLGGEPFVVGPRLFAEAEKPRPSRVTGLTLAAQAIRDPDEIRWVWTAGERPQLLRRYVRAGRSWRGEVDILVDAAVGGGAPAWRWRTSLEGPLDLDAERVGVLAWRRAPPEVMAAVHSYTGGDFYDINSWLRFGEGDEDEVAPLIAGLDDLLADRRLPRDQVVWRGLPAVVFEGVSIRPGDIVEDLGFMSTSTRQAEAQRFADGYPDGILLQIRARAGTVALDISRISGAGTAEYEVLFARGTRLKVVDFEQSNRTLTLETVVDPAED